MQLNDAGHVIVYKHCTECGEDADTNKPCKCGKWIEHKTFAVNTAFLNGGTPYLSIVMKKGDVIMFPRGFPHFVVTISKISIGLSINWLLTRSKKLCVDEDLFPAEEYQDSYRGPNYQHKGTKC